MSTKSITTPESNTSKHRLTLFINPAITKHARAQAVIEEITLTQLVEKALFDYLPTETVIRKPEIKRTEKQIH